MRKADITRATAETKINVSLNLDGTGKAGVKTDCGFLDHMLTLLAYHGRFDLFIECEGDIKVDYHHTVEDCGIALGQAFLSALDGRRGMARYGSFIMPMDETLVLCAVDISGRPHVTCALSCPSQKVGDFDTELVSEFFLGLARALGATIHIRQLAGENSHHIIEAAFKGFGRAMRQACAAEGQPDSTPSTKGVL